RSKKFLIGSLTLPRSCQLPSLRHRLPARFPLARVRPSASHPMRIVFALLPAEVVSGRRRLRRYPRWIIVWAEADSLSVWLRHRADSQQKTTRHNCNTRFHNLPFLCAAAQEEDQKQERNRYSKQPK